LRLQKKYEPSIAVERAWASSRGSKQSFQEHKENNLFCYKYIKKCQISAPIMTQQIQSSCVRYAKHEVHSF